MGKVLVIASTSGPFSDFGPFVPSINDRGMVAFFAARRGGATGAFCGDGGPIHPLHRTATYRSHPDLNNHGTLCVFADLEGGASAVLAGRAGAPPVVIRHDALPQIGPLGPTINDAGAIAFRATSAAGHAGIYVAAAEGTLARVAEAGEQFSGFDGLPVIIADGAVVFRADHADGAQGIHVWRPDGTTSCVVSTGGVFAELGRFPAANPQGTTVVFTATRRDGTSGIFVARDGRIDTAFEGANEFESLRGALIDGAGRLVFYATPGSGELAVYALDGPGARPRRLIGLRDEFGSCPLTDFALNPVSFNDTGQIALRLKLADGRQFIGRLDVFG